MHINRREFLVGTTAAAAAAIGVSETVFGAEGATEYLYHGRVAGEADWRIIEPGLRIAKIESFVKGSVGVVRVTASDGRQGYGQMSTFDADITAQVLHRKVAPGVLGQDLSRIDAIVDRCIESNYKFPWSFVCRALAGVDTAIWDLYGRIKGRPVCELIGGKARPMPVYGSSMRRDISPEDEATRLVKLRDEKGLEAFKVRLGRENGHDGDASPGRTEKLIPAIRKAVGERVRLLADGNSCYTPPKAIEVGRLMEQNGYAHFEEPCPYWELEWTAEVAAKLDVPVAGGEQDNDLAQFRRMIGMNAVDILQPDICYIGGFTRAMRVAKMAERAKKQVVPHSANLSMATLFAMHLMAGIPNAAPHVEFTIEGGELSKPFYRPGLEVKDGKAAIAGAPGWGVEIDQEWLKGAEYRASEKV